MDLAPNSIKIIYTKSWSTYFYINLNVTQVVATAQHLWHIFPIKNCNDVAWLSCHFLTLPLSWNNSQTFSEWVMVFPFAVINVTGLCCYPKKKAKKLSLLSSCCMHTSVLWCWTRLSMSWVSVFLKKKMHYVCVLLLTFAWSIRFWFNSEIFKLIFLISKLKYDYWMI